MRLVDAFLLLLARMYLPSVIVRRLCIVVVVCTFALMTGSTLHAQEPSPQYDPAQVTVPTTPPSARAGSSLFSENCAPCHGDTGHADGPSAAQLPSPPTAFADPQTTFELSPGELFFTAKFGRMDKMMPPWGQQMSDEQIWNAVAYALSLHTTQQAVGQGEALYNESCASCHGAMGAGDGPDATETMANFADQEFATSQSPAMLLAGWQDAHADLGNNWTSDQKASVLDYIRTFSISPPWVSPYKAADGVIQGTVVAGTAGQSIPEGAVVTLDAFLGFDPVATFTTTLSTEGTFAFHNLSQDPNINFIASLPANGANYSSDFMVLSDVTPTVSSQITVFGTTDDPNVLSIDRFHWIVQSEPGALLVGQVYALSNSSDKTFVGRTVNGASEPVTFAMHLPPGAEQIAFDQGALGERFVQVGPVIYDTLPVQPGAGTRQIIVRYVIPVESSDVELSQDLLYPTADATLLVADLPDLKVDATGLQFSGVQSMGDTSYQLWAGTNLDPISLDVTMNGVLQAGDPDPRATGVETGTASSQESATSSGVTRSTTPPIEPWVAGLIAGLVSILLIGFTIWAWRSGRVRFTYNRSDLTSMRADLIEEIAHLDDLHALGDVTDDEWMRRRARLKTQLLDVDGRLQRGRRKEATA